MNCPPHTNRFVTNAQHALCPMSVSELCCIPPPVNQQGPLTVVNLSIPTHGSCSGQLSLNTPTVEMPLVIDWQCALLSPKCRQAVGSIPLSQCHKPNSTLVSWALTRGSWGAHSTGNPAGKLLGNMSNTL